MKKKSYKFHPNDTKLDKKMVEITKNQALKSQYFPWRQ